tara:strand:- start:1072 stop:1197 length:126 start_codon:yes stop_codon:yes gene_type:complete
MGFVLGTVFGIALGYFGRDIIKLILNQLKEKANGIGEGDDS